MNKHWNMLVELVSTNILRLQYRGELEDEDGNLSDELVDQFFDDNFGENDMDRFRSNVKSDLSRRWKEINYVDRSN